MIRKHFINNLVLQIYEQLPILQFPIKMNDVYKLILNCKYMSYQKFAYINHCSIEDVIAICNSKSGCTHYDPNKNRYLILLNLSKADNNYGRQRWTAAHEIGHIQCKHHLIMALDKIAENGFYQITNPEYEAEADYFAATLLSPFPLFEILQIKSVFDLQNTFGISSEAACVRYKEYLQWKKNHRKTAWERKIINCYKRKFIASPNYG